MSETSTFEVDNTYHVNFRSSLHHKCFDTDQQCTQMYGESYMPPSKLCLLGYKNSSTLKFIVRQPLCLKTTGLKSGIILSASCNVVCGLDRLFKSGVIFRQGFTVQFYSKATNGKLTATIAIKFVHALPNAMMK